MAPPVSRDRPRTGDRSPRARTAGALFLRARAEREPLVAKDEARAAPADRDEPEVPVEALAHRHREDRAVHLHLDLGATLEDVEEHDRVAAHRGALPTTRGRRRPGPPRRRRRRYRARSSRWRGADAAAGWWRRSRL